MYVSQFSSAFSSDANKAISVKARPSASKSQQLEKGTGIKKVTTTRILNGSD